VIVETELAAVVTPAHQALLTPGVTIIAPAIPGPVTVTLAIATGDLRGAAPPPVIVTTSASLTCWWLEWWISWWS